MVLYVLIPFCSAMEALKSKCAISERKGKTLQPGDLNYQFSVVFDAFEKKERRRNS